MSNTGTGCPLNQAVVRAEVQPPRATFGKRVAAFFDRNKDRVNSAQSLITILAIFVGGFWTYQLFVQQRQSHPRLKIEYRIQHWKISDEQVLLSVDEILTNAGPVMVELRGGTIRVIQVMPLPRAVAGKLNPSQNKPAHARAESSIYDPKTWDVLVESPKKWEPGIVVIEPGESEIIPNEFIIPATVRVVAVFSFLSNPENSALGWNGLVYYDFDKPVLQDVPKPLAKPIG